MITYWQMIPNGLLPLNTFEKGCIVNVTDPTPSEIGILNTTLKVPDDFLADILDVDERSRMEVEDDLLLMIYRIPYQNVSNGLPFTTIPLGLVLDKDNLVIICHRNNEVLDDFFSRSGKGITIETKIDLILHLFIRTTMFYHRYLKQINNQTTIIEQDLEKSTRNEELHRLLKMEKCLVYFTTSLRSNEAMMLKLKNSKWIRDYEFSSDLLEEATIENRQAIEMAKIYSDIQSGMMDAFASVISNNLNIVMKSLTIVTIVLMIPTLIASFYGMNVPNRLETNMSAFWFLLGGSVVLAAAAVILLRRKKWM
ncbi:MAG TPA: magnesium transporter CorA family protein [Bacteroidales bacterium]|jgi:magnesium transporter|nr:magnesium transporter CorA family protein [Bacteroidales bacterium]OPZ57270.1 MAG: Magnesium transport protein CorA [Bacteroidetes bacterium ADurb.BinA012]HHU98891.1 magnesium transporter CorA family protein [Bacteroidales bacterium]HPK85143.1 magnesium transporter CorA family protein [Bacteroidales bacterium]HPO39748.1 magnesium transporter CorA family protein [Bacteroidales bacterium]